jgi:hypothetical protein
MADGAFAFLPPIPGHEDWIPLFAGAGTFVAITEAWLAEPEVLPEIARMYAGVVRGRELRNDGVVTVPCADDSNRFAGCQNDLELVLLFGIITEEPPGDGEWTRHQVTAWLDRVRFECYRRRDELLAAGAARGLITARSF